MACWYAFSRSFRWGHVLGLISDWFIWLFSVTMIGQMKFSRSVPKPDTRGPTVMFSWMKSSSGCEWSGRKAISFDCTLVLILRYSTEKCSVFLALFLLLLNMFWRNDCCCHLQFSMENYRGLIQDMSPQDREVSRPKEFSLLLWQIIILVCVNWNGDEWNYKDFDKMQVKLFPNFTSILPFCVMGDNNAYREFWLVRIENSKYWKV